MVTMCMVKVNTEVCRRWVAAVVMLGRVMVLLTDHSLDRRVVLSRELLAQTTGREVDTVGIVVAVAVVVVGTANSIRHRLC